MKACRARDFTFSIKILWRVTVETLRYERDCLRKAREAPLIHEAKTIGPLGIRKRNKLFSLCNPYHVHL